MKLQKHALGVMAILCLAGASSQALAQTVTPGPSTVSVGGDAVPNSTPSLATSSLNYLFNGTSWDRTRGDTNGAYVGGNVASGSADAGRPVKVGGVFNSARPTYTNGSRTDLQVDSSGNVYTALCNGVTCTGVLAGGTDGRLNGSATLAASANGYVFNGTTWDRLRGDTSGLYISGAALTALQSTATNTTGAATSANQTTGNTSLANVDADLGAPSDAAYAGGATASVIAGLKGIYTSLAAPLPAGTNIIGQVNGTGTDGLAPVGGGVRVMGRDQAGFLRDLATSSNGGLIPAQTAPAGTPSLVSTTAGSAQMLLAANTNMAVGTIQIETTLTAPLYICLTVTYTCSSTAHDLMLASGATAGTLLTLPQPVSSQINYFTSQAGVLVNPRAWVRQ